MDIKALWFYLNILFIASYTVPILRVFVRLPLPRLPHALNVLVLIVSYAITLVDVVKNIPKLVASQNLICIGLFMTFPHASLLFPFYLLSVYHANLYVLSHKKKFSSLPFFKFSLAIGQHAAALGRAAMYAELLCASLALVLIFLRLSSIKTFIMYLVIIRQQYINNEKMRSVVSEMLLGAERLVAAMPEQPRQLLARATARLRRWHLPEAATAKKTQ